MGWLIGPGDIRFAVCAAGSTTVGRDPDNDIVLQHDSVSRRHATLTVENGSFYLLAGC